MNMHIHPPTQIKWTSSLKTISYHNSHKVNSISIKEPEFIILNLPKRKILIFNKYLGGKNQYIFYTISSRKQKGKEQCVLRPALKAKKKKQQTNYKILTNMSINSKILNEILTIQINNNIKTIIYYQQVEFISGMQDFSTFENQSI